MSLTELTEPDPRPQGSDSPVIDIVAVHGLYETELETWIEPETKTLWLRDLFPHRQLKARVLVYGYKAEELASPGEGLADPLLPPAVTLVERLSDFRHASNADQRPIVFVCHGLGGILIKRSLVYSSDCREQSVRLQRSIHLSTCGILFFGTPHYGIEKDALFLLQKQRPSRGPSQFTISLLKDSEMLQDIEDQFAPLMEQLSFCNFWAQLQSRTGDVHSFIVRRESAAPPSPAQDSCGIFATHSGMVKFKNVKDHGYRLALEALTKYASAAPRTIRLRWDDDLKQLEQERKRVSEALSRLGHSQDGSSGPGQDNVNEKYVVRRSSVSYFTGRSTHAMYVKDKLGPIRWNPTRNQHKIVVIHGLGGSGKTQFCLKYIEDNRPRYWGIFWIDASSEENAESDYAFIGQDAGKGQSFAAGIHSLSNQSAPWLLVLDNADDPDLDVSRFLPAGGYGHILVTTRNRNVLSQYATAGQLRFRGMDPEEAIALLFKSMSLNKMESPNPQRRSLAQAIAGELGYLALALSQAGATIRKRIYTLEKYLHHYLGQRRRMLSVPYVKNADDANIITTWEIPFQRILRKPSAEYQDAADLVHTFAFMHYDSVPESIFQKAWADIKSLKEEVLSEHPEPAVFHQDERVRSEEPQARLRRALTVLYDHSIIEYDTEAGTCSLHPLVHSWARERLDLAERKQWLRWSCAVLAHSIPSAMAASGRDLRRRLLSHITSCLEALKSLSPSFPETLSQAAQVSKFASVYAENGNWKAARTLQEKVEKFCRKKLGWWHIDTIQARRNLAHTCWNLFEVRDAIITQLWTLFWLQFSRPSLSHWLCWPPWLPEHLMYCVALTDLTLTLWLAGRLPRSRSTGERAVNGLMKQIGPDDPLTLDAMFNLARTYLHLGKHEESKGLLLQVLRRRKHYFGMEHPDTLMARNELGMCLHAQNRTIIAQRLVQNVLESRKRILGTEHAYTLWSVNDLSKVICDRGRPEEAAEILEAIIPVVGRTLGDKHVGMTMTQSNLSRAYIRSKNWKEAERVLQRMRATIRPDHPDRFHAGWGHAHVKLQLNQVEQAEQICKILLEEIVKTKALKKDDKRTLLIAGELLKIYRLQERDDDIAALKKTIPAVKEEEMTAHPHLPVTPSAESILKSSAKSPVASPDPGKESPPLKPILKSLTWDSTSTLVSVHQPQMSPRKMTPVGSPADPASPERPRGSVRHERTRSESTSNIASLGLEYPSNTRVRHRARHFEPVTALESVEESSDSPARPEVTDPKPIPSLPPAEASPDLAKSTIFKPEPLPSPSDTQFPRSPSRTLYTRDKYSEMEEVLSQAVQGRENNLGREGSSTPNSSRVFDERVAIESQYTAGKDTRQTVASRLDDFFFEGNEGRPSYTDSEIMEISSLLKHSNPRWHKTPRTYIILRIIGCLSHLDDFIDLGFTDHWFPFTEKGLPPCLRPSHRSEFVSIQDRVLTKSMDLERGEGGQHCYFQRGDALPFERKGVLGSGGFGEVDKVLSLTSFKEYARKRVTRSSLFGRRGIGDMKLFVQEIEILKRLKHDHVVEFVGSYTDSKYVGLIMSPVAEMDLSAYLTRTDSLKYRELRSFFGCLARALEFLHEQNVRHKDIKPGNILVDRGKVLLTDFGLALDFTDASGSTTMGMVNGMTSRYCAPEVALFEPRNSSSDVWSLGVVFLEMIAVLKGKTLGSIDDFFKEHGSRQLYVRTNPEALSDFVAQLRGIGHTSDNRALRWIQQMLQIQRHLRPTAASLAASIIACDGEGVSSTSFCGICCVSPDSDFSEAGELEVV